MSDTSIRDVFLSMQFPPVDEIVATSKTGIDHLDIRDHLELIFRLSNYSQIASFMFSIV